MKIRSNLAIVASLALLSLITIARAADPPVASVAPDEALAKLKAGNERFVDGQVLAGKSTAARRAETANSQHPLAIVVGCADSRTAPEIVFDQNLGDLFVDRSAGNLVDDHALGSIEYAVAHLGTRLIVVMGHSKCGAVQAALASDTAPGHIQSLVRDIQPAVKATEGESGNRLELTIAENARLVAARIRRDGKFGALADTIRIVPAVYHMDSGKVEWLKD